MKDVFVRADATWQRLLGSGSSLQKEGQDVSDILGIAYKEKQIFFHDTLPKGLESIWTMQPGKVTKLQGSIKTAAQNDQGQVQEKEVPGIFLVEVLQPLTETGRTVMEAPVAFSLLSKTESGITYAFHDKIALDGGIDTQVGAALRGLVQEIENGQTLYEAELRVSGRTKDVTFDTSGAVVKVEEEVALKDIPAAARDAIQKSVGKGKLLLMETVTEKGTTYYEAHIKTPAGKEEEVKVDAKGVAVH